jgi:hypothetical protein
LNWTKSANEFFSILGAFLKTKIYIPDNEKEGLLLFDKKTKFFISPAIHTYNLILGVRQRVGLFHFLLQRMEVISPQNSICFILYFF